MEKPINHHFKKENSCIYVVGKTFGHLEQSAFLQEVHSINDGQPPEVNLLNEKNNGESILKIIENNLAISVHDISSGGLLVALAEMSLGSNFGSKLINQENYKFN